MQWLLLSLLLFVAQPVDAGAGLVGYVFGGKVATAGSHLAFNGDAEADLTNYAAGNALSPAFQCSADMTLLSISYATQTGTTSTKFKLLVGGSTVSWPLPVASNAGWVALTPTVPCVQGTTLAVQHDSTTTSPGSSTLTLWFNTSAPEAFQPMTFTADSGSNIAGSQNLNVNNYARCTGATSQCEPANPVSSTVRSGLSPARYRSPLLFDSTFSARWASSPQPFTAVLLCTNEQTWAEAHQATSTPDVDWDDIYPLPCPAGAFVGVQVSASSTTRLSVSVLANVTVPAFVPFKNLFTVGFGGNAEFNNQAWGGTIVLGHNAASRRAGAIQTSPDFWRHVAVLPVAGAYLTRVSIVTTSATGGGIHYPSPSKQAFLVILSGGVPWVNLTAVSSGSVYPILNPTPAPSRNIAVRWEYVGYHSPFETQVVLGFQY